MFHPPRCPFLACTQHQDPKPGFCARHGHYRSKCQPRPIPRFRCRACGHTFSRQTFHSSYRDQKPKLNQSVVKLLCSGIGFRQTARLVRLTSNNLVAKARKISRHVAELDQNLKDRAGRLDMASPSPAPLELQMDEFETYETRRNTRPISIPVVIDPVSRFRFAAIPAPIRPRGRMTASRIAAIQQEEARFGPRRDLSGPACIAALQAAAETRPAAATVILGTDCKASYPGFISRVFADRKVYHQQTLSKKPRGAGTSLFAINHTEACLRDRVGRLRRESWLVSKKCRYLDLHLRLINGFRNWVIPRFNADKMTPAQFAGFAERPLRLSELLGWRQDWGALSPSPFCAPSPPG